MWWIEKLLVFMRKLLTFDSWDCSIVNEDTDTRNRTDGYVESLKHQSRWFFQFSNMFEHADLTIMSRASKIQVNQPTAGVDLAPRCFLPVLEKVRSHRVSIGGFVTQQNPPEFATFPAVSHILWLLLWLFNRQQNCQQYQQTTKIKVKWALASDEKILHPLPGRW